MPYKNYEEKKQKERERYKQQKEQKKEYNKKYKEENRDKINASIRKRKENNRKYLIEMLGGKCVGCGITENLQFDHIDRKLKSFTIGKMLESSLENKLIPEAKKCQLLCKSCHQLKTTINHDMHSLADGYSILNVVENGDEVIVTLKKIN
jgi:5-methylcytosine-specific restriction endonuclease McrA